MADDSFAMDYKCYEINSVNKVYCSIYSTNCDYYLSNPPREICDEIIMDINCVFLAIVLKVICTNINAVYKNTQDKTDSYG